MQFQLQTRRARFVAASALTIVFVAAVVWFLRSPRLGPRVGGENETGEFLLVDAGDRALEGAPALALTFSLPLDARKTYDRYVRVFQMPAPPRPATRGPFFNEPPQKPQQSAVSVKPEDTNAEGGTVVSGAWVVGDNPRLLYFPHIKPETRYVVLVSTGLQARNGTALAADSRYSIQTAPVPPAYYFASNGMVLPAGQNGGLPVITVNVL